MNNSRLRKKPLATKIVAVAAVPTAIFAAVAFGPASPATASTTRGGADVGLYCAVYHASGITYDFGGDLLKIREGTFGTYPAIAKNDTGKWDGWECDRGWGDWVPGNRVPVNMNDACAMLFGSRAVWAKKKGDRSGAPAWAVRVGEGAGDWRCVN